jgi:hypothetical protein
MSGTEGRSTEQHDPTTGVPETREEAAVEAAAEVLHPAIPLAGAAILMETDPRLHQVSDAERALKRLVESNEAAEEEADEESAPPHRPNATD